MIRAGEYRHQLEIQKRSTTQDSAGEPLNTWSTFAIRRCAIERKPGSEVFASVQRNGRLPVVFRVRYLDGVTAGMRIIFDGRVHNITSPPVDQNGRGEELLLVAEELAEVAP